MNKQLLLLLMVVIGACVGAGGSGPKENCNVQYSSNGAVISQLKPDYVRTYVDSTIRYAIEVTNLGEEPATNIKVTCTNPSELLCLGTIFADKAFPLNPPDTTACIEGETKQDPRVEVKATEPTGEEPAYLRVMLSYGYSSLSWAEVAIVSEAQWQRRVQQGIKPVQSSYQSASPIKIELGVPDAPVVFKDGVEFPVTLTLKNTVDGYAYPQTSAGDQYKVDSVTLEAPENSNIEFSSSECTYGATHKTCTLSGVPITTEEDAPKSKMIKAKITSFGAEEEIYKLTATAKYTYVVKYASPQGVEIQAVYTP